MNSKLACIKTRLNTGYLARLRVEYQVPNKRPVPLERKNSGLTVVVV